MLLQSHDIVNSHCVYYVNTLHLLSFVYEALENVSFVFH